MGTSNIALIVAFVDIDAKYEEDEKSIPYFIRWKLGKHEDASTKVNVLPPLVKPLEEEVVSASLLWCLKSKCTPLKSLQGSYEDDPIVVPVCTVRVMGLSIRV